MKLPLFLANSIPTVAGSLVVVLLVAPFMYLVSPSLPVCLLIWRPDDVGVLAVTGLPVVNKKSCCCTDRKRKKNSLIYKEIQKGAVANSYSIVHPTLFQKRVDSVFNFNCVKNPCSAYRGDLFYDWPPPHIWLNICAFPHILGSPSSILIYDFATAPFWMSLCVRKFWRAVEYCMYI